MHPVGTPERPFSMGLGSSGDGQEGDEVGVKSEITAAEFSQPHDTLFTCPESHASGLDCILRPSRSRANGDEKVDLSFLSSRCSGIQQSSLPSSVGLQYCLQSWHPTSNPPQNSIRLSSTAIRCWTGVSSCGWCVGATGKDSCGCVCCADCCGTCCW